MARIRTIKPDFFRHYGLYKAEVEFGLPLRQAFAGLWTACDREGRFKWSPDELKLDCLPFDPVDFSRVLDALVTRGHIVKYAFEGKEYGFIPSWHEHQVINNREAPSKLPDPKECAIESSTSTRDSRVDDAIGTPLVHAQAEGKGKEGKGKEGNDARVDHSSLELQPTGSEKPEGDPVKIIFAYWQKVMNSPKSVLDANRRGLIEKALKNYSPEDVCRAIRGCSKSPHNMGQNEQNTKYNGLDLILRNAEKIDRFIRLDESQAKVPAAAETITQRNARIMAEVLETAGDAARTLEMED